MNPAKNYETPAIFVADSANAKIIGYNGGRVATTYASINGSCPDTCSLKATKECYAMLGPTGIHSNRLNESAKGKDTRDIARFERRAIEAAFGGGKVPQDGAQGGRDLRLHTAGDARTPSAARELARATLNWFKRQGGKVWTYTHAWRTVSRSNWGMTSVLASVESASELKEAIKAGYAPALIVPYHDSPKASIINGVKMIPCPAQTKESVGCADCRLCMDADGLVKRNSGISFAAHGVKRTSLSKRLKVL